MRGQSIRWAEWTPSKTSGNSQNRNQRQNVNTRWDQGQMSFPSTLANLFLLSFNSVLSFVLFVVIMNIREVDFIRLVTKRDNGVYTPSSPCLGRPKKG